MDVIVLNSNVFVSFRSGWVVNAEKFCGKDRVTPLVSGRQNQSGREFSVALRVRHYFRSIRNRDGVVPVRFLN